MPIDAKLLALLRCPVTKQSLRLMDAAQLERLNRAIKQGGITRHDGNPVAEVLEAALITTNQRTIYPILSDIPVMLEGESIAFEQLQDSPQDSP